MPHDLLVWFHTSPPTANPGVHGQFKVAVFSETPFEVTQISTTDEWQHVELEGEWDDEQCGGCPDNRGWHANPQWLLSATVPTRLTAVLELSDPSADAADGLEPALAIGCLLLRGGAGGGRKVSLTTDDIVAQSGFFRLSQAALSVELPVAAGPFCLVPCTFEPGGLASFRLHLYSDNPLTWKRFHPGPSRRLLALTEEEKQLYRASGVDRPGLNATRSAVDGGSASAAVARDAEEIGVAEVDRLMQMQARYQTDTDEAANGEDEARAPGGSGSRACSLM